MILKNIMGGTFLFLMILSLGSLAGCHEKRSEEVYVVDRPHRGPVIVEERHPRRDVVVVEKGHPRRDVVVVEKGHPRRETIVVKEDKHGKDKKNK